MIWGTFRLRIGQFRQSHIIAHMSDTMSVAKTLQKVKQFIPPLSPEMHKGQAGRVAVVGGSDEYFPPQSWYIANVIQLYWSTVLLVYVSYVVRSGYGSCNL